MILSWLLKKKISCHILWQYVLQIYAILGICLTKLFHELKIMHLSSRNIALIFFPIMMSACLANICSSRSCLINFTNHSSYTYYFVILSLVKAKYVTKLYGRMFCLNMQFTMQELGGTCWFHHTMLRYLLENLSNGKNKSILVARYIDVLLD